MMVDVLNTRYRKANDEAKRKNYALLARTISMSGCQSQPVREANCPTVDVQALIV